MASQKASTLSSDDEETDTSEKARTQRQHDASDVDALSLFGDYMDEREDVLNDVEDEESDNTNLLFEIISSLSFTEDSGPPITRPCLSNK